MEKFKVLWIIGLALIISFGMIACDDTPEDDPTCDHNYQLSTTKPSTCLQPGTAIKKCTNCGEIEPGATEEPLPLLPHGNYEPLPGSTPANCTTGGSGFQKCTRDSACTNQIAISGNPLPPGHPLYGGNCDYNTVPDDEQGKPCQPGGGMQIWHCKRQPNNTAHDYKVVTDKQVDHLYVHWSVNKPATCTQNGQKSSYCFYNCQTIDYQTISPLGHVFSKYYYNTNDATILGAIYAGTIPTCTAPGRAKSKCDRCTTTHEKIVPAPGHKASSDPSKFFVPPAGVTAIVNGTPAATLKFPTCFVEGISVAQCTRPDDKVGYYTDLKNIAIEDIRDGKYQEKIGMSLNEANPNFIGEPGYSIMLDDGYEGCADEDLPGSGSLNLTYYADEINPTKVNTSDNRNSKFRAIPALGGHDFEWKYSSEKYSTDSKAQKDPWARECCNINLNVNDTAACSATAGIGDIGPSGGVIFKIFSAGATYAGATYTAAGATFWGTGTNQDLSAANASATGSVVYYLEVAQKNNSSLWSAAKNNKISELANEQALLTGHRNTLLIYANDDGTSAARVCYTTTSSHTYYNGYGNSGERITTTTGDDKLSFVRKDPQKMETNNRWFLPSLLELEDLYKINFDIDKYPGGVILSSALTGSTKYSDIFKKNPNCPAFESFTANNYWTSTQIDNAYAYSINFGTTSGPVGSTQWQISDKNARKLQVRPIAAY